VHSLVFLIVHGGSFLIVRSVVFLIVRGCSFLAVQCVSFLIVHAGLFLTAECYISNSARRFLLTVQSAVFLTVQRV
jgi:hypothetical protein